MKSTDIQTFLMHAGMPDSDGWPRVVEIAVCDLTPLLIIDIVEDAIVHYPSTGNVAPPNLPEYTYFRAREQRAAWLQTGRPRRTEDFV